MKTFKLSLLAALIYSASIHAQQHESTTGSRRDSAVTLPEFVVNGVMSQKTNISK